MKKVFKKGLILLVLSLCLTGCDFDTDETNTSNSSKKESSTKEETK